MKIELNEFLKFYFYIGELIYINIKMWYNIFVVYNSILGGEMSKTTFFEVPNVVSTGMELERRVDLALHEAQNKSHSGRDYSQELAECLSALNDFADYNERILDAMEKKALSKGDKLFIAEMINPLRSNLKSKEKQVQEEIRRLQMGR